MTFKTAHSFRNAVGLPKDILPVIKELGYASAPIADISSTFGWFGWNEECEKAGLKPVFGVSLYVTPNPAAKKPAIDLWTFFAIDDIKAVTSLVRLATSQFRYNSLLTYEQALSAEGVVKIAGYKAQREFMNPADNLYIALSPATAKGFYATLPKDEYKYIKWQENRYPTAEDEYWAETATGRNWSLHTYPQHILTDEEWEKNIKIKDADLLDEARKNLDIVLDQCNAKMRKADLLRPEVDKTLEQMCLEGAKKYNVDLTDPVYKERLETELKVILDKEFEDYFFIVADLMQWAQSKQMVGPGRGSSAGSLVCYLLGITQVDPIPYGLLFFRFLDPGRGGWRIQKDFVGFN